jgi:hypothetical protein
MVKSILRYSSYVLKLPFSRDRAYVFNDTRRSLAGYSLDRIPRYDKDIREKALDDAVAWLLQAQKNMADDGFGSFHLLNGWSTSYPETTGYIIPTLIRYAHRLDLATIRNSALKAASWLVDIQKPSGGWQAQRMADNKPEVVFNTGQVVRGMLAAYKATENEKYLDSAVRAGNWLVSVQHPGGYWKKSASMEQHRVYDSYVDAPLVELYRLTGEKKFRDSAVRNLEWIAGSKMAPNGWFEDCDNTMKHNRRPIIHTIAYTLDGLIDCGKLLERDELVDAARKGSDKLLEIFLEKGYLHGRYDENWNGTEHFICTGGAQLAVIWLKLYRETLEERYLQGAGRMIDLLIYIQQRRIRLSANVKGAIPGSFPVWGKYEPFAFPNWATKFFADALMRFE